MQQNNIDTAANIKKKHSKFTVKKKEALAFYLLIMPFIIMFFVVKIIPIIWGMYLSFTNYTGFNWDSMKLVGINNYIRVFADEDAKYSFFRTLYIGVLVLPSSMIVSLFLAMILNKNIKGKGFFRTVFYLPAIVPALATAMLWRQMFDKNVGIFNAILKLLGFNAIDWLGYNMCTYSLVIMMLWASGSGILVNLAALKGIPKELYEAADIEGASSWQKTIKITLPMISAMLFFNLVTGIIGTLQIYAQPVLLIPGGGSVLSVPPRPNYVYLIHVYQQIFGFLRYGYGLSLMWLIFIFINLSTAVLMKTSKFWVFSEIESDKKKINKSRRV